MFKNYLKVMFRIVLREKSYALINIFGLSLGMTCCVVLGMYVNSQLSYDRHLDNHDRLVRLVLEAISSGTELRSAQTSPSLGPLLKIDYPESIAAYTRFQPVNRAQSTIFRGENESGYWDRVYYADINVFDVFSHNIIYGNPQAALEDPFSIAVSESFARTYFSPGQNPVGEVLSTDTAQYHITLVYADLPATTHLKYDVLLSMNRLGAPSSDPIELQRELVSPDAFTYVLMSEGVDADAFDTILADFEAERVEALKKELGLDNVSAHYRSQNLSEVHFDSSYTFDEPTGNIFYIYGFAAIAFFILAVACINYINVATARSMQRSKEVGMRKALGAERGQLIWQFLSESLFFVMVALLITLSLVDVLARYNVLGNLFGQELYAVSIYEPQLLLGLVGISLLIGLLSGLYPAVYLSSATPLSALSGRGGSNQDSSARLRKLLVLVQFTISIGIIASTLLMANQMRFLADMSLGFNKENKLLVPLRGADLIESLPALRDEMTANPNILGVSTAVHLPGGQTDIPGWYFKNQAGVLELHTVSEMEVGEYFIETMGAQMKQGRSLAGGLHPRTA